MATQKKINSVSLFASVIETDNKVVKIDGLPIQEVAEKALNVTSFIRRFSFEVLRTLGLDIASARCIVVFSIDRAGKERQSSKLNLRKLGENIRRIQKGSVALAIHICFERARLQDLCEGSEAKLHLRNDGSFTTIDSSPSKASDANNTALQSSDNPTSATDLEGVVIDTVTIAKNTSHIVADPEITNRTIVYDTTALPPDTEPIPTSTTTLPEGISETPLSTRDELEKGFVNLLRQMQQAQTQYKLMVANDFKKTKSKQKAKVEYYTRLISVHQDFQRDHVFIAMNVFDFQAAYKSMNESVISNQAELFKALRTHNVKLQIDAYGGIFEALKQFTETAAQARLKAVHSKLRTAEGRKAAIKQQQERVNRAKKNAAKKRKKEAEKSEDGRESEDDDQDDLITKANLPEPPYRLPKVRNPCATLIKGKAVVTTEDPIFGLCEPEVDDDNERACGRCNKAYKKDNMVNCKGERCPVQWICFQCVLYHNLTAPPKTGFWCTSCLYQLKWRHIEPQGVQERARRPPQKKQKIEGDSREQHPKYEINENYDKYNYSDSEAK